MKRTASYSVLEPLESRIAPAATILVDLTGGNLTLTTDANDTQLSISPGPNGTYKLFSGGNNFDFADNALDTTGLTFVKVTGNVVVNYSSASDLLTIQDLKLKSLTFNGGGGNDGLTLTNVAVAGDVTYNGGANADQVSLSGLRVTIGGNALFNFGDGANKLNGGANTLKIGKNLTYHGGTGADDINNVAVGTMDVKGALTLDLGTSGAGNVALAPVNLSIGGDTTVTGGDGVDFISFQPVTAKFGKKLSVDTGENRNTINFDTDDAFTVGGAIDLQQGSNPSMTKGMVAIISAGKLKVGGGMSIANGDGYIDTTIRGATAEIGGHVAIVQGSHDNNATNFLGIAGLTKLSIKGGLSVTNGDGVFVETINAGNLLSIGGTTSFKHGNHTMGTLVVDVESNYQADLKGGFKVESGNGDSFTTLKAIERLNVGGDFRVSNGTGGDTVTVVGEKTAVKGKFEVEPGVGISSVGVTAKAALNIGGDIYFAPISGTNANFSLLVGGGTLSGKVGINSPTTTLTSVSLFSTGTPLALKKGFFLDTESGAGDVIVLMQNLAISGETFLNGGSESTDVTIDDVTFGGKFTADLKDGEDHIAIERNDTVGARLTTFAGDVSILLGDTDNDRILIGLGSPGHTGVFRKGVIFDGGAGTNDQYSAASAIFSVAGQPVKTGFE